MKTPKEVQKIKEFIESSSLPAEFEEGGVKAKNFWIKIKIADHKQISIEYHPRFGYGFSFIDFKNDDIGYGEGHDEISENEESVVEYIKSKLGK